MKVSLKQKIVMSKLLEAVCEKATAQQLKNYRSWCRDTQKDKSKGEDFKFAWELFWRIPAKDRTAWCDVVCREENCHDSHIATVLKDWVKKNIVRIISEKEACSL